MPYIAICQDDATAASGDLRQANLEAHFSYIESIMDQLLVAGPAGGATNREFRRSIFIYDTEELSVAERLLHDDPYFRCGLYGDVTLEPFIPAAGRWVGGTTWSRRTSR